MDKKIRLAIVGCGALTRYLHLPASRRTSVVQVTALIDQVQERARDLAQQFGVPRARGDCADIAEHADAAIVALPNHLHAPVTMDLLKRGIHVLVEKPMAMNAEECRAMCATASAQGAVLAVGLVRRFFDTAQFVKRVLDSNMLGKLVEFDYREGAPFGWPVASDYAFRKEKAGGGVLIDIGAYAMDFVQWWFGRPDRIEYRDDSHGGVEADCDASMDFASGLRATVDLSRTRLLRNTLIVRGENGTLEAALSCGGEVRLNGRKADFLLAGRVQEQGKPLMSVMDAFVRQFEDFAGAVSRKGQPLIPGEEGAKSVELIESCYQHRRPLPMPWLDAESPAAARMEARVA